MPSAQSVKEAGNKAFRDGKYDEAVTCYSECMRLDPSESTYPLNRSMAYLKLLKYSEAERDATRSLNLLPAGNPKALYRRALARKALGRLSQAKTDLEAALAEDPSNVAVKTELASLEKQTATPSSEAEEELPPRPQPSANTASPAARTSKQSVQTNKAPETANSSAQLDDQRKSALKAAITPQHTTSSTSNGDLLQAVSSRRLAARQPEPTKPVAVKPTQSGTPINNAQMRNAAAPVKQDFLALRSQRQDRQRTQFLSNSRPEIVQVDEDPQDLPSATPIKDVAAPRTAFDFDRRWRDDVSWQARAALLKSLVTSKTNIPAFFGDNLDPELVDAILVCLNSVAPGVGTWPSDLLDSLSKCARFELVSMMCASTELVREIIDPSNTANEAILRRWGLA